MPVSAAHPDAVKLDEAFAEAMGTPGKPREPGPPPEVDRAAPFGRDDNGEPVAPHGFKKDGQVRLTGAGRRPAEEKARVTGGTSPSGGAPARGSAKKGAAVEPAKRYAPAIADTLEVVWLGGSVIGQAGPDLPVVGRFLPDGDKLQAQAAIFLLYRDNLANALDLCAQHNDTARKLADRCASGGAGWALNAAFMLLPVIGTSIKIWAPDEALTDAEGRPVPSLAAQLADQNRTAFSDYMEKLAAQAQDAAQAQETGDAAVPQDA